MKVIFYSNLRVNREDYKEMGELTVNLPCNKGDVVYDINHDCIIELTVIGFRFGRMSNENEDDKFYFPRNEWCVQCESNNGIIHVSVPISKFGKTFFLTKEDAEQALKHKGERNVL